MKPKSISAVPWTPVYCVNVILKIAQCKQNINDYQDIQ